MPNTPSPIPCPYCGAETFLPNVQHLPTCCLAPLKKTVVSKPGAAITVERIEMPDHVKRGISENLRRGREAAQREQARQGVPWLRSIWNLFFGR